MEIICPNCKNPIYDEDALLCHFCGESLRRPSRGLLGKMKYAHAKWAFAIIIGILLLMFFLLSL